MLLFMLLSHHSLGDLLEANINSLLQGTGHQFGIQSAEELHVLPVVRRTVNSDLLVN